MIEPATDELAPEEKVARSVLDQADRVLDEDLPAFRLAPVDFASLLGSGVPEPEYFDFPYLPCRTRLWLFGPAEAAKTLWAQHLAAKLTRDGRVVVFFSEENPLETDVDRMGRLRPKLENLRYFHATGLDLADPAHFTEVALACHGANVVFFDTLTSCWSGDEGSNAEIGRLDRERLAPLVRMTGVTTVTIHHVGHPQAFVNRGGVGAGRGASAMGQKADVVLVFRTVGPREFTIEHAKNRTPGGHKEAKARFRIVDTDDGGLDIERVGNVVDARVIECMTAAVEIVGASDGTLGTNALKSALHERGFGGSTLGPALDALRSEDPPRLRQSEGFVVGPDGARRKGKPWTLV